VHGLGAESILITGPSGSSKTTIAKYILRQLKEETLGIGWGYTNCISSPSESALIYSLETPAGRTTSVPKGRRRRYFSIASGRWTTTSSRSSTRTTRRSTRSTTSGT
jgi:Cdc6-like AAA superfamily ATPase